MLVRLESNEIFTFWIKVLFEVIGVCLEENLLQDDSKTVDVSFPCVSLAHRSFIGSSSSARIVLTSTAS